MTTYSLMDGAGGRPGNGPSSLVGAGTGPFTCGIKFAVAQGGMFFTGYRWWVPPGGDTGAQKFCLWNMTGATAGTVVPGSVVTSGTLTAGAFNVVTLATPIPVAIGTEYLAATGWNVVAGFPITNNQFGSGQPYSAGIVNGPLTAFSDSTGGGTNNGIYSGGSQGMFATTGTDPTTNMPNRGSNSSNFWVDVIVSDQTPASYSGTYRLYPNKIDTNAATVQDTSGVAYDVCTNIRLSQPCQAVRGWYYSPAGAAALATTYTVWSVATGQPVMRNNSPAWLTPSGGTATAGSGWVSCTLTGTLPPGDYRAGVFVTSGADSAKDASTSYWGTGYGSAGITWGPLYAPPQASASPGWDYSGSLPGATPPYSTGTQEGAQCVFGQTPGNTDTFPQLYVSGLYQNYWTDLEVLPVGIAGGGTAVRGRTAPRGRSLGSPPPLVRPAPVLPASGAAVRGRHARKGLSAGSPAPFVRPQEVPPAWGLLVRGRPGRRGSARGSVPIPVIGPPEPFATGMLVAGRKGRKGRALGSPPPQPVPPPPYIPVLASIGTARWLWALGMARNDEGESLVSLSQSALSTQPVQLQVNTITETGTAYDPTSDTVQMAFVPQSFPPASPTGGQWQPATWATDSSGNNWATILVGPENGGVSLAYGDYQIWVSVTSNPAIPVLPGPILSIF